MDEFFDFEGAARALQSPEPHYRQDFSSPGVIFASDEDDLSYVQSCTSEESEGATAFDLYDTICGPGVTNAATHQTPMDAMRNHSPYDSALNSPALDSSRETSLQAKAGARFSKESLRVLRTWLTAHHRLPYPSDKDKEILEKKTGLSKTQISNWIANARRRGKVRPPRSMSPGPIQMSNPVDIPRRATPIPMDMENMVPLERWKNSPPELEPASVTAIVNALSSRAIGYDSPYYSHSDTDSAPAQSLCNSSGPGTSASSGDSFPSVYSNDSSVSFTAKEKRRKGQRRRVTKPPTTILHTPTAPRKFQCTFCTETFKTKYDWQRHEKSLHISLERWICAPHGSIIKEDDNRVCVFCGIEDPDQTHSESHNYLSCANQVLEKRTFFRKDHLRQHLQLVHTSKFNESMNSWKVETPAIKSRCGFCDILIESWEARIDHLATHFKMGKTMAHWIGDWGFERHILGIVENGIPPYLIDFERNTPRPYQASKTRRIQLASIPSKRNDSPRPNIGSPDPLESSRRKTSHIIDIHGHSQHDSETTDPLFPPATPTTTTTTTTTRLTPHHSIQSLPSQAIADSQIADLSSQEICYEPLVNKSTLSSIDPALFFFLHQPLLPLPSTITPYSNTRTNRADRGDPGDANCYRRLVHELSRFVAVCTSTNNPNAHVPTDEEIQRQARWIIYDDDDPWNQTAADNWQWMRRFKRDVGMLPPDDNTGLGPYAGVGGGDDCCVDHGSEECIWNFG